MLKFNDILPGVAKRQKWYHVTNGANDLISIIRHGFRLSYREENDYGNGIYFTNKDDIGDNVISWNGAGIKLLDCGKDYFSTLEEIIGNHEVAMHHLEGSLGDAMMPADPGAWDNMNEIVTEDLGYDGLVLRNSHSKWGDIAVVYNVEKLNKAMKFGKYHPTYRPKA